MASAKQQAAKNMKEAIQAAREKDRLRNLQDIWGDIPTAHRESKAPKFRPDDPRRLPEETSYEQFRRIREGWAQQGHDVPPVEIHDPPPILYDEEEEVLGLMDLELRLAAAEQQEE
jgi:hypothetical protein